MPPILPRLATALQAGFNAARMTYREQDFAPFLEFGWDSAEARRARYAIYTAYDYNTVYTALHEFGTAIINTHHLYRHIRGIYNPVKRSKDIFAANVYRGAIDRDDLTMGAMPLVYDNEALTPGLQNIVKWSNLEVQLGRNVRDAVIKGDSAWWIVDDPLSQRVRLEALDPSKIRSVELDSVGNVQAVVIEYTRSEERPISEQTPDVAGTPWYALPYKTYTYTLYVDREWFREYRDRELIRKWPNPYPFVPLKMAPFSPGEGHFGVNAFYSSLPKIDALNDGASLVLDQVRKTVVAILKAKGIQQGDLDIDTESRSGFNILYLDDPDTDIEPLVTQLDIASARAMLNDINHEIERDMPELAFQAVREGNERITAPGVEAALSDGIGRVEQARHNLDPAVAAALQMALTIGGMRGYAGFRGIDASTYDAGKMELRVNPRPVIAVEMDAAAKLLALTQVASLPPGYQKAGLKLMGYSDAQIGEIMAAAAPPQTPPVPADTSEELQTNALPVTLDGFWEEAFADAVNR